MLYRPRVVANALLRKAQDSGEKLSHLKLQKLMFFMHAWNLALHDKPLIDEQPEAWPYGPVFSSLYHELKNFGSNDIGIYLKELDRDSGRLVALAPNPRDQEFWSLLDQVWDRYGKLSAAQLSSLSHVKDGPWEQARRDSLPEIPNKLIAEFYRPKLVYSANVN